MDCLCYTPRALNKIADGIKRLESCEQQLMMANGRIHQFVDAGIPANDWWQSPGFVVGGIAVSFSVGLWLGALVVK